MPVLTPAELWQASGRYEIPEVFKLKDRSGREFVLPMTHEETVTFHAREIQSYRQLPQILYHFSVKDRDEPRPRGGLLRVREFIMKDAYSFDRDSEGLDVSFGKHARGVRADLRAVRARVRTACRPSRGSWVAATSIDYLAPSGAGENTLVTCERGDYAADLESGARRSRAPGVPGAARPTDGGCHARGDDDRGSGRVARDRHSSDVEGNAGHRAGREVVLALVRGDDRLEEAKLAAALGTAVRPATEEEIRSAFGADPGSIGPIGFAGDVVADETLREGQFVAGANRTGWHLRRRRGGAGLLARASPTSGSRGKATPVHVAAGTSSSRRRSR